MPAAGSLFLGVISGTSMDGLDLALIDVSTERPGIVDGDTVGFEPDLRRQLDTLATGHDDGLDALGTADTLLGRFIGNAIVEFLATRKLRPDQIKAIGSHGQTIRHRPDGSAPYSCQIGDPNIIAEITGITTVADFRRRDMAAGGQGAPLVPPFHAALFRRSDTTTLILNIGGISNITVLSPNLYSPAAGFDTGPGNALLDAWVNKSRQLPYDSDGAWASSGECDSALLERMLADPYFSRRPPKSTGREHFNQGWIEQHLPAAAVHKPEDVQATLAALTATTIAMAIRRWGSAKGPVIVCGGGRLNGCLMQLLASALPKHDVVSSDALGVNGDWIEAAAFAWLAAQTLAQRPGNEPAVTGARGPRILGAIYGA
jgi:anhydro-N-acetylmuramic acid kinase